VANRTLTAAKQSELNEQAATSSVQKASKFISICCAGFAALGLVMNQSGITQSLFDYNTKPPMETSAPTPLNPPAVARQEASSRPTVQTPQTPSGPSMPTAAAASADDTRWLERFLAANGGCSSKSTVYFLSTSASWQMQQVQDAIRAGRLDVELFGKPILKWSDADVAAALRIYHDCEAQLPPNLASILGNNHFDSWKHWIPETVALARAQRNAPANTPTSSPSPSIATADESSKASSGVASGSMRKR
jgi:hypothetical protein